METNCRKAQETQRAVAKLTINRKVRGQDVDRTTVVQNTDWESLVS